MPTPDERMVAALDDLESLIAEGDSIDAAIGQAARDHDFSIEAVALRAAKKFGDLTTLKTRLEQEADNLERVRRAETAIDAYLSQQPEPPFPQWFEERVGRPPTTKEDADFTKRYLSWLIKDIKISDVKISK